MKFTYRYVTGEVVEIEVDDKLGEQIATIEHESELKDRAETRRHQSIDQMHEESGFDIADPSFNVNSFNDQISLQDAISKLTPPQQFLIRRIYFEGLSLTDVSRIEGVTEGAVRKRLNKALVALKNIFD
jgi:RNA polymerase sigma factor (sigma-70 family)